MRASLAVATMRVGLLGIISGCAALLPAPAENLTPAQVDGHHLSIPVIIRNDNMQDVTIYVLHHGVRSRMGTATAAAASTFTYPAHYSSGAAMVRFAAVPVIGGRNGFRKSVVSDPVSVHVGQQVMWNLESDLARSTIGVYAANLGRPDSSGAPADTVTHGNPTAWAAARRVASSPPRFR